MTYEDIAFAQEEIAVAYEVPQIFPIAHEFRGQWRFLRWQWRKFREASWAMALRGQWRFLGFWAFGFKALGAGAAVLRAPVFGLRV